MFCKKNTMLLFKYCIWTLGKERCKKYIHIQIFILNLNFQATYTVNLEFCTFYNVKEKEIIIIML